MLSDGRVSTKGDKEPYHVRDIERYYEEYTKTTAGMTSPDLDRNLSNVDNTVG